MNQIKRQEESHPGAKNKIEEYGLSVCRNDFGMKQAVDLAGEQILMRSVKTTGSY